MAEILPPGAQMETRLKTGIIHLRSGLQAREGRVCVCVGGGTPHSTTANQFQLGKSGCRPRSPLVVQRCEHHCGAAADRGSQDGIPAAQLEGAGAGFPALCASR